MIKNYCIVGERLEGTGLRPRNINGPTYTPVEVATLYGFPNDVDGTGQIVGIIELGGGYRQGDLLLYLNSIGITKVPNVVDVSVNGGVNNPDDTSGANFEVCLDLDIVAAIAPGANIRMYFAPNSFPDFVAAVQAAVTDGCNIISISWGLAELQWPSASRSAMNTVFQNAANQGVTIFSAAGDNGASDGFSGLNVDFPGSCPFGVSCGGTTLTSAGGVITNETVWGSSASSATGGGSSAVFNKPSYQNTVPLLNSATKRGTPDMAGNANPSTGYIVRVGASNYVVGGTSAVSPLLAAFTALVNQKRVAAGKVRLGLIQNPLYTAPLSVFRDITVGGNFGYNAAVGWDYVSGLGSPSSDLTTYLLQYQISSPVASFTVSALSGNAPLTVNFTDTSTNSPTSWSWNFGNGSVSTAQNPATTYNSPGTYTATLTVTNVSGSSSASTSIVVNAVTGPPQSAFAMTPSSGTAPLTVTFSNASTGSPSAWLWNFGNGTSSTLASPPPVTYSVAKTYTVSLTVSNSAGSSTSSKTLVVNLGPPVANFRFTNRTVSFKDTSTNSPTSWLWTFGDGTSSTARNPVKTYNRGGTFNVTLKASSTLGFSLKTQTITLT